MRRALLIGIAGLLIVTAPAPSFAESSETYRQLNLFGDVFERVRADYVEDVTDHELIEAAIKGMLSSLDPHSTYLNADTYRRMQETTRGEFGGLGIEVSMENGFVKVISPIEDTPAFRAGVKPGDLITHLDDEPVLGLTLREAVEVMRGPIDTDITLTVARAGTEKPLRITIKRGIIPVRSVRGRTEDNVGYVRISAFTEQTEPGLRKAIDQIKGDLGDKMEGLILDLRSNPGGLLDQAVAVSDAFLTQGEIVSTRGRRAQDSKRYNARGGDLINGQPIIVLIDGGSASASEIVAGALQDHQRAIILGTKSFGKGSVQTIMPLGRHGAIRLTTSRYYTPSGRSIQATGIDPDIVVPRARLELLDTGPSRSEATLRGHLDGQKEDKEGQNRDETLGQESDDLPEDYQLVRAVDLMHALALFGNRAINAN